MDSRFKAASGDTPGWERAAGGIGTLGEGTLHAVLKDYYTASGMAQEVKIGPYVADIAGEDGVIEIQTRALFTLKDKLAHFLSLGPVTVVHPLARVKRLLWIDPDTGAVSKGRKSPKVGTVYQGFFELYGLKAFLRHPNFRAILTLVDLEEYRALNGRGPSRKRGAWRYDRVPTALAGEIRLENPGDYRQLIPAGLETSFTSAEFAAAAGIPRSHAQRALNLLHHMGTVDRTGRREGAWVYCLTETPVVNC